MRAFRSGDTAAFERARQALAAYYPAPVADPEPCTAAWLEQSRAEAFNTILTRLAAKDGAAGNDRDRFFEYEEVAIYGSPSGVPEMAIGGPTCPATPEALGRSAVDAAKLSKVRKAQYDLLLSWRRDMGMENGTVK